MNLPEMTCVCHSMPETHRHRKSCNVSDPPPHRPPTVERGRQLRSARRRPAQLSLFNPVHEALHPTGPPPHLLRNPSPIVYPFLAVLSAKLPSHTFLDLLCPEVSLHGACAREHCHQHLFVGAENTLSTIEKRWLVVQHLLFSCAAVPGRRARIPMTCLTSSRPVIRHELQHWRPLIQPSRAFIRFLPKADVQQKVVRRKRR